MAAVATAAAASERAPQSAERRGNAERRLLPASDTECVRGRRRGSVPVASLATGSGGGRKERGRKWAVGPGAEDGPGGNQQS